MRKLTPETLLRAYASGVFPMAEDADDPRIMWIDPEWRGVIPLEHFHIPRRLARTVRQDRFQVTVDQAFRDVILACAASRPERESTWINQEIVEGYSALHTIGLTHSVECWRDDELVGGLYGLALGGAFFGESMFSIATDASKVALVHLVARLRKGGFALLDAQFQTDHLSRFGAEEIPRAEYHRRLAKALPLKAEFYSFSSSASPSGSQVLQEITQTS